MDWNRIEDIIKRHYNKGRSATGRESYTGLLLFKIALLQTWYNLSDYEVEDQVKDRISFSKFVGIPLGDDVPDHSVISRFRTVLTKQMPTNYCLMISIDNWKNMVFWFAQEQ